MSTSINNTPPSTSIPFYRDIRVLRWVFQLAVVAAVLLLLFVLYRNLRMSLDDLGLDLSFEFMTRRAGFRIAEGPPFDADQPVWQAYFVGLANTVRAVSVGIILTTIVGLVVGISRLSDNWLVRKVAQIYIEIEQNVPLLVQLFFYLALVQALPRPRRDEMLIFPAQPIELGFMTIPQLIYLNRRSSAFPGLARQESFFPWLIFVVVGLVIGYGLYRLRINLREREGLPPVGQIWWALGGLVAVALVGWIALPGAPLALTIPTLEGDGPIVNYSGGWQLTAGYLALVIGLTLYTGAFVAEVVRAGIQSVSSGQIEAATALGLTRGQRLRLVIMPQALRVIIPPLINQYLNLTKNSTLAIAVAYPDVFNVTTTIGNQTGQNIQIILLLMATFLVFSLSISFFLNQYNRRTQIVTR